MLDEYIILRHWLYNHIQYDFMLTFTDNPLLFNKVSVTVNILDVNEFPPQLAVPSDTFVCENSKVGQVIWTVSVGQNLLIICVEYFTPLFVKYLPEVLMVPWLHYDCYAYSFCWLPDQVIQTVSAVDKDLPPVGQRFFFKTPKELRNRNFTVRDFGSKFHGEIKGRRWLQTVLYYYFRIFYNRRYQMTMWEGVGNQ